MEKYISKYLKNMRGFVKKLLDFKKVQYKNI